VDFSFLAEAEPDAARAEPAVLARVLAWLLASAEEERVCFEVAALAADVPAAGPVADAAAEELVAGAAVVLAADAPAAEPVADVAAEALVADAAQALAADELVAGLVVDVATEPVRACSALAEGPAADELGAELVAGAQAAALPVWRQAD